MNILFIQPKLKGKTKFLNKWMQIIEEDQFYYLHLSIYYIASITPLDYKIKIFDERFEKKINFENYNLIVISCSTPFAPRAYELADLFRKNGKTVVLCGPHPSLIPDDAKPHADSVIIGEPDIVWINLLKDYERSKIKPFYKNSESVNPSKIKKYRYNLKNKKLPTRVEAGRGCPNCCSFCLAPVLLGTSYRTRPILEVIKDIKQTKEKIIHFDDSSLTTNPDYTKKLFKELKKLKKKFTCCGNVNVLSSDEELLKIAKEAGCIGWFIGFESFDQNTLERSGKKTNKIEDYKKVVNNLHKNKMAVMGSFMFGFDTDNIDVFEKTYNGIKELGIDSADFNILGVYPGTSLFNKMEEEGRIISKEWSKYHFGSVVFKPKNMTNEELEKETWKIALKFFSLKNIMILSFRSMKLGYYPFKIMLFKNITLRRFYRSWKTLY